MNEVSNFCNTDGNGQTCANTAPAGCPAAGASQTDCCLVCTSVDSSNKYDYPPYAIHNGYGKLSTKTMAMSATHYSNITVYDAHNLYGLTEQIATASALRSIRASRSFVLSRSSFISSGKHTAKWTGDNAATWNDLKASIVSIMDFNIFAVPAIGADICGFIYDTTEELCARWIEVGAFYPFSRNHNTLGAAPQELYLWDSVTEAAQKALGMRYMLLPYMYTLFYQAHSLGETVARPMWFNYPSDSQALTIDRQFMLGSAILVSPVLDQGKTSVTAYFPKNLWYNFATRSLDINAASEGQYVTIDTPLTSTNVHVAGGNIVPLQGAAMTTTAGRKTPFTLLVALSSSGVASGSLFWDDGDQINLDAYLEVAYSAAVSISSGSGSLSSVVKHNNYVAAGNNVVDTVTVMSGSYIPASFKTVTLNGVTLAASQITTDTVKQTITFTGLNVPLTSTIQLSWK
jgi:alpha-D-xyloside xylohydrolase